MKKIKRVNINDKKYPSPLRVIPNPPRNLYYKGEILPNENCFAIVGARDYTKQGKQIAVQLTKELSKHFTIVAGLARGVDAIAHYTTLKENKRTIAVLGTGIDESVIYPKENKELAKQIVQKKGCLISEYPPQTKGSKKTFPERNRIIAGLSIAILAINARKRSGTSITIRKAQKQKKKVFIAHSDNFKNTIKINNSQEILKRLQIQ